MASGVKAGDAWVAVHPETKDFYNKLKKDLLGKGKDDDPKIRVRPEVDRNQWQRDLNDQFKDDRDKPKVAVGLDKDKSTIRSDLAKEFRNKPITVDVRLSDAAKNRVRGELAALAKDEVKTIRVRTVSAGGDDIADFQKELDKQERELRDRPQRVHTLELQFDKTQIAKTLRELGKMEIPIALDKDSSDELYNQLGEIWNEYAWQAWPIKVKLDKASRREVEREFKSLTKPQTKVVTVKYVDSKDRDSKKSLKNMDGLLKDKDLQARVTLKPDDSELNEALDKQRIITLRPELSEAGMRRTERRLEQLTRPRFVEILTGETRFSGFTEDLSQALQTAWEDLDPRLSLKEVFGDDIDKLKAKQEPTKVELPEDFMGKIDFPEVQKVYVVNQPKGAGADDAATGSKDATQAKPTKIDVADVSTDKPVTTKTDGEELRQAKPVVVTETRDMPKLDWDLIEREIRRSQARGWTGNPEDIHKKQIGVLTAQMERFLDRAGFDRDRVRFQRGITEAYEPTMQKYGIPASELVGKYKAWNPESAHHLQWMLQNNDLGSGRTLDFLNEALPEIDKVVPFKQRASKDVAFAEALEKNNRLFADFLKSQIDYLTERGPRQRGGVRDVEGAWESKVEASTAEMRKLTEGINKSREELAKNTQALTYEEKVLKNYNLKQLEKDPNAKYVSMSEWRKMHRPKRGEFHFDWDGIDEPGMFSNGIDRMTSMHGREGNFSFYAKSLANTVMKPFGKLADATYRASHAASKSAMSALSAQGNIALATGGSIKDGTDVFKGISPGIKGLPAGGMDALEKSEIPGKIGKFGRVASRAAGPVALLTGTLGSLVGLHTKLGAFGVVLGGLSESVMGLGAMGSAVLAPFANSLKSIVFAPALFTALGAAVGSAVVAFQGIGTAFGDGEEAAEAFNRLSDSAKSFVTETKQLRPAFDGLREATQEAFFTGWGDEMEQLAEHTIPALNRALPEVAKGFGSLGEAFIDELGRPNVAKNFENALVAIGDGFDKMSPGVHALTDFFMNASRVGAERMMPALGKGFSNMMISLRQWGESGGMVEMMDSAVDGLRKIGDFTGTAWSGLSGFFKGAAEGADRAFGPGGVWGSMMNQLDRFKEWSNSMEGRESLAQFFEGATESAKEVGGILGEWGEKIITETGPAFRDFIKDHGGSIEDIGSSLIDTMTNGMYAIGPIIDMIKGPIDAIAKTAEIANNLVGGPGSEKRLGKMDKQAANVSDAIDGYYDDRGGEAFIEDSARNLQARKEAFATLAEMNREIAVNAESAGTSDEMARYVEQANRLTMAYEGMRGGFDGATVSAEATAAMFQTLGEHLVEIPDTKTLVVEGEGTETTRRALQELGAEVEEIGDTGNFEIKFENEMEIAAAIGKIQAQMQDMPEAEIRARGLDTLNAELTSMKAQMDGMSDKDIAINVEASELDSVKDKLKSLDMEFTEKNGSIYLDTNIPEVRSQLEDIGAISDIDVKGNITWADDASDKIGELLEIDGTTVTALMEIIEQGDVEPPEDGVSTWVREISNKGEVDPPEEGTSDWVRNIVEGGDVEPPEPGTVEWLRNIIDSGAVEEPPSGTSEWLRLIANGGEGEPPSGFSDWVRQIVNADPGEPANSSSQHDRNVQNNDPGAPPDSGSTHTRTAQNAGAAPPGDSFSTHVRTIINKITSVFSKDEDGSIHRAGSGRVVKMADGGTERQAMVAKAGSYILWAENETEDETYIPHAKSKRKRSTQILAQTARDFGLSVITADGTPVLRDGTDVGPTNVTAMANGGTTRSQRLREENRRRATAEAYAKVEANKKKPKAKATAEQKAELAAAEKRGKEIEAMQDKEYARRLVAIRGGKFIYADTDPEHEDAVRGFDRQGLVPREVSIRRYADENDEMSQRSLAMLAVMEHNGSVPPELRPYWEKNKHKLPPGVRHSVENRTQLPPHVQRALLTGEPIEDPDAPVDLDEVLESRDWARAAGIIAADPRNEKSWHRAGHLLRDEATDLGRYVGEQYATEAADIIGLNVTKLRDIPLYNTFNPSADAYNELIRDVHGGRRNLEGQYNERYREEQEIYRKAEQATRDQQNKAKQKGKLDDRTAEQMAKDIETQNRKNAEEMAQYNAGMAAVREHRAQQHAMNTSRTSGGVTVNQSIGNITTNNAQDAADRFRRQATVGFENIVGGI